MIIEKIGIDDKKMKNIALYVLYHSPCLLEYVYSNDKSVINKLLPNFNNTPFDECIYMSELGKIKNKSILKYHLTGHRNRIREKIFEYYLDTTTPV